MTAEARVAEGADTEFGWLQLREVAISGAIMRAVEVRAIVRNEYEKFCARSFIGIAPL
jgi:hypothetical protein